jgi:hypothetical protein
MFSMVSIPDRIALRGGAPVRAAFCLLLAASLVPSLAKAQAQPGADAAAGGGAGGTGDADPSAAAGREIRIKVDELLRLREERRRRDQEHRDKVDALRRQVEVLTGQTTEAEAALKNEQKQLGELQAKIALAAERASESGALIGEAARRLAPTAQRTLERIRTDASRDKTRRAGELSSALAQLAHADPNRAIEGFRDVVRMLGAEWTPARSISVENETVELDGGAKQIHAWTVTVGFVARGLVSEDHEEVGLLSGAANSHQAERTWKFGLPAAEEDRIRDVVRIVRGQKPPSIGVMPIPVPAADMKAIPARGDQGQTPPAPGK